MDLITLIPQFGGLAFTVGAFVVAILTVIAVHEYGHYIIGRLSGIHAEVFSIGFGPVLWSHFDKRGTKWQIAAIPFGGYVRFLGDSNAASGKDGEVMAELSEADKRRSMHGAPLWARAATVAAGPVFNFIWAIGVFFALAIYQGNVREPLTVGDLLPLPKGTYELREGDVVLQIAGVDITDLSSMSGLSDDLPMSETLPYVVERDGDVIEITGPYTFPPMVNFLVPRGAAISSGLEVGDVVTSIDGQPIFAFSQLKAAVEGSNGTPLELEIWRGGDMVTKTLVPERVDEPLADGGFQTVWRIGIVLDFMFEPQREFVGIWNALSFGASNVLSIISDTFSGLYHVISGQISTCNLSGPVGIAETSGAMASQGLDTFVYFIAFLSTAIGLMNLLPVPVLDGGHLVFHVYEATVGRPPNDTVFRVLMTIGLAVVLSFMLFAFGNDIACNV